MRRLLALPIALCLAAAAHAAGGHPGPARGFHGPPMDENLFPPDLLLSNQIALGLSDDQVAAIKTALGETHPKVIDVQTRLQRVAEQLDGQLEAPRVDEAAALNLASQAMDLEKQIKTAHMSLLIRVKNLLTPEQQEKARALRPADERMKYRRVGPEGGNPF